MELNTLDLRQIILHQISQGGSNGSGATLSDMPTPLDDQNRNHFQMHLRNSLNRKARPVVEDPGVSEVAPLIREYLSDGQADFIRLSQLLAEKLQEAQRTVSSPGILLVADALIGNANALIIA